MTWHYSIKLPQCSFILTVITYEWCIMNNNRNNELKRCRNTEVCRENVSKATIRNRSVWTLTCKNVIKTAISPRYWSSQSLRLADETWWLLGVLPSKPRRFSLTSCELEKKKKKETCRDSFLWFFPPSRAESWCSACLWTTWIFNLIAMILVIAEHASQLWLTSTYQQRFLIFRRP